ARRCEQVYGRPKGGGMSEAAELRANGMSWNAIARTLGITTETAKCWADPEYKKARQERINEMRRQRKANGHVPVARGARRPTPPPRPVVIPRNLTLMELARGECK